MLSTLVNKVTIVTGAGQGIGEGIAKVFARAGAKVVVASRSRENSQQTVDEIIAEGHHATLFQMDCGIKKDVQAVVENTVKHYGRLDIVIHNAAVFPMHSILDFPDNELDNCLDVNFKPCFWFAQAAIPHMRRQGGGRFIFTSSVTGPQVAMPLCSAYGASKAAINAFVKTAALEYGREKITFNCIEPGYIHTRAVDELADKAGLEELASYIPCGHLGRPEDIAYGMLYLASDEAAYVTGQALSIDGGSLLPESPVQIREYYQQGA